VPRAFSPSHVALPLPEGHRFPVQKYARLAARLSDLGWRVDEAPPAPWEDVARVHTEAYLEALKRCSLSRSAERKLGFPQSPALLQRALHSVGGTLAALYDALERGYGVNLAGGTHHAFADRGEGFCVLNDHAVAAYHALERDLAARILVVDLDVHQGNGSANLFAHDPRVFTFSVHGARNYPFQKERSSRDVPLEDGVTDEVYLGVLTRELPPILETFHPDLVLYIGGVDVLAGDRFGRTALSLEGVEARDAYVFGLCKGAGVPLVYTMGGGYHRDLEVTVEAHVRGVEVLRTIFSLDTDLKRR